MMIGYLTGTIVQSQERFLLLDVSGVGYKIFCPLPTLLSKEKGDAFSLFIHTRVREDAITLFGFEKEDELFVFEKLLDVPGVGPRSALSFLSIHSPSSIASAIENEDASVLSHIPGIGKKTAEKTIIELKGKLVHLLGNGSTTDHSEVRLALEALGYSPKEVHEVLSKLNKEEKNVSALIRQALSLLQ